MCKYEKCEKNLNVYEFDLTHLYSKYSNNLKCVNQLGYCLNYAHVPVKLLLEQQIQFDLTDHFSR